MKNELKKILENHDVEIDTADLINEGVLWVNQVNRTNTGLKSKSTFVINTINKTVEILDGFNNWVLATVSFDKIEEESYCLNFYKEGKIVASIYFELIEEF